MALEWLDEMERSIEIHSLGPEDDWCHVLKADQHRLCRAVRELMGGLAEALPYAENWNTPYAEKLACELRALLERWRRGGE